MPTTTNFGWTTPADTDLVKDGALAIRTLGNGIDTSMAELKGGTTGQVLSKTSNTDMDFTWVTTDDANAIQNAIVDAKGDLIAATANDTPARLAVGTNNQTLYADSSAATGLSWGASAKSVLTTTGDTLYASGANTLSRLAIGSSGQVLTVASGIPSWATPASGDFKLIDNTTFSAVTSFSRDSVFSATYDIYKIYIRGSSSSGLVWSLRFRSGGSDTTTNYVAQRLSAYSTTVVAARPANTSEISTFPIEGNDSFIEITIVNPYNATRTTGIGFDSAEGNSIYHSVFGHTGTTSFDGYKFLSGGSETITGEQWVYGLKV